MEKDKSTMVDIDQFFSIKDGSFVPYVRPTDKPKVESKGRTLTMLEAIKDVEDFYNRHHGKISISHDRMLRKHGLAKTSNIVPLSKK